MLPVAPGTTPLLRYQMGRMLRGIAASMAMAAVALSLGVGHVAAATETLECGLFRDYVAPDPTGPTPGRCSDS